MLRIKKLLYKKDSFLENFLKNQPVRPKKKKINLFKSKKKKISGGIKNKTLLNFFNILKL